MIAEWAVIVVYLVLGLIVTWLSSVGHKFLYGTEYGWPMWIAGVTGWPVLLLIGIRKH